MKIGAEDRKKLIAAGSFGVLAIGYLIYTFVGSSGGGSEPASPAAPASSVNVPAVNANRTVTRSTSSRLDPELHPEGMVLTESLVYSGGGRNIFQSVSAAAASAPVKIPKAIASARYQPPAAVVNNLPPPAPPIELRFFGTAMRQDGKRQAFFLRGDDVLLASQGDVVSRRYRVGAVSANSVEVTDLTNNNTQRIPMSSQ